MDSGVAGQFRVRLAPSPTGFFHFGTARTGLFNWLFVRENGGKFVLRIEDTDTERSDKKYEVEIAEGLLWLGIEWDEGPEIATADGKKIKEKGKHGPYRQSERKDIYAKHLKKLLEENKAYYCYCTKEELEAERQAMMGQGLPPKYSGHCGRLSEAPAGKKPQVIRFRTPEIKIELKDMIRGKIEFDASILGDMVIAKSLEAPLYNFAVVVDDEEMAITHVIRGEDHLSNTPKQILIQRALGFKEPIYAHLPLILGADRAKLSKRYLETSLLGYREQGYLPEAVVNFLVFLGWHPKDEREIFSLKDLIHNFDIKRVQKSGAIFDEEKLEWLNAQHIKTLTDEDIAEKLTPFLAKRWTDNKNFPDKGFLLKVIKIERERIKKLSDFLELAGFFFELPDYEWRLLIWQKESGEKIKAVLQESLGIVNNIGEGDFNRESLEKSLNELIIREGKGAVLWPLRVAVSGRAASPDPLDIMSILGFRETLRRIQIAVDKLV